MAHMNGPSNSVTLSAFEISKEPGTDVLLCLLKKAFKTPLQPTLIIWMKQKGGYSCPSCF